MREQNMPGPFLSQDTNSTERAIRDSHAVWACLTSCPLPSQMFYVVNDMDWVRDETSDVVSVDMGDMQLEVGPCHKMDEDTHEWHWFRITFKGEILVLQQSCQNIDQAMNGCAAAYHNIRHTILGLKAKRPAALQPHIENGLLNHPFAHARVLCDTHVPLDPEAPHWEYVEDDAYICRIGKFKITVGANHGSEVGLTACWRIFFGGEPVTWGSKCKDLSTAREESLAWLADYFEVTADAIRTLSRSI